MDHGLIVEMEPYVVRGERILPNPEQWFYISIPAVEVKRGNRLVYVPGYEILSSRNRQNSLALAGELQMRQVANALVFPDFISRLPHTATIVILDDGRLSSNTRANSWEGDSLYTARALAQFTGRPDRRYSIGTQISTHLFSDFVVELPSRYDRNANRELPLTDSERAVAESEEVTHLVGIASNGGPLTVYLDDTRDIRPQHIMLLSDAFRPDFDLSVPIRGHDYNTFSQFQSAKTPPNIFHRDITDDGIVAESAFGRELSQRLVILGRQTSRKSEPEWLRVGFGLLCRQLQVSGRQVEFGEFPDVIKTTLPKLADILTTSRPLFSVKNGSMMAALFVHYCLYSDNGARSAQFIEFLDRLANEPYSEELFVECFRKKVSAFHSAVIGHSHVMTSNKRLIFKWDVPPVPKIVAREATQSEVARLKAEALIARGQSPKALDELRIAYWRGEREPWMLALLALLEEHIGSISRAEKITKMLLVLPQVPARAYVIAAKLRMRELGVFEKSNKKLDIAETNSIMDMLIKARKSGLLNEDFCATLAKLVVCSAEPPHHDTGIFLLEAAKRLPLNRDIVAAIENTDM